MFKKTCSYTAFSKAELSEKANKLMVDLRALKPSFKMHLIIVPVEAELCNFKLEKYS